MVPGKCFLLNGGSYESYAISVLAQSAFKMHIKVAARAPFFSCHRSYMYEQREELHTVDRAMGVHRSSLTTRPGGVLGGLVDNAVIRRATPHTAGSSPGKVEKREHGGKTHVFR